MTAAAWRTKDFAELAATVGLRGDRSGTQYRNIIFAPISPI